MDTEHDLKRAANRAAKAKTDLAAAERERRITATIAVRDGFGKVATAAALGVSRPTLDAWIAQVEATPDELKQVTKHEKGGTRHPD